MCLFLFLSFLPLFLLPLLLLPLLLLPLLLPLSLLLPLLLLPLLLLPLSGPSLVFSLTSLPLPILQVVFFKGVLSSFRKEVWPFLLGLYEFDSTRRQRTRIQQKRHDEYRAINSTRYVVHTRGNNMNILIC